jgi:hypothetical protein
MKRLETWIMIACVLCVAGIEVLSGINRHKVRQDMAILQKEHTRFWIKHYKLRGRLIKLFDAVEKDQFEELRVQIERMKFDDGWIEPNRAVFNRSDGSERIGEK